MFRLFTYFLLKKFNFTFLYLFILPLTSFIGESFAENINDKIPWVQWKKAPEIQLEYRHVNDGDLIEVKAQIKLTSSLSAFLLFLLDTDNVPNWLDNAKESQVLKTVENNTHIFTTEFYGFWPISSREMIIRSHQWQNDDLSVEIHIENAFDLAKKKHTILVDVMSANWLITPTISKEGEKTLAIEYTFIVDAKGNVPTWLVNSMTLKSTWQTLKNIKKQLPQSKWQSSTLAHINEISNR